MTAPAPSPARLPDWYAIIRYQRRNGGMTWRFIEMHAADGFGAALSDIAHDGGAVIEVMVHRQGETGRAARATVGLGGPGATEQAGDAP